MTARVEWTGVEAMQQRMEAYAGQVLEAIQAVADYFEPVLESHAKQNAPWTDRTSNARQTLNSYSEALGREIVALYLAHGMEYGKWLEIRWSGRYAIIWPTIEAHLAEIGAMLQRMFA